MHLITLNFFFKYFQLQKKILSVGCHFKPQIRTPHPMLVNFSYTLSMVLKKIFLSVLTCISQRLRSFDADSDTFEEATTFHTWRKFLLLSTASISNSYMGTPNMHSDFKLDHALSPGWGGRTSKPTFGALDIKKIGNISLDSYSRWKITLKQFSECSKSQRKGLK